MDGMILDEGLSVKELITQLRSFGVPDETLNILEGKGIKSFKASNKKDLLTVQVLYPVHWIKIL